jgi:hypothetical protein
MQSSWRRTQISSIRIQTLTGTILITLLARHLCSFLAFLSSRFLSWLKSDTIRPHNTEAVATGGEYLYLSTTMAGLSITTPGHQNWDTAKYFSNPTSRIASCLCSKYRRRKMPAQCPRRHSFVLKHYDKRK